jgi:Signal transduction histidine kinase
LFPFKNLIQSFVDKHFFKASYLQVIEQNDLLHQQIIRSQRYETMSKLSRNILAELDHPLGVLMGYQKQLPDKLNDREFLDQFMQVFDKEMDRMQGLVRRLSDFSDPKPLSIKSTDITAVMNDVIRHVTGHLDRKKVDFCKFFPEQIQVMMNIDGQQIKQALLHILMYVVRSINEEGQVWVGMEEVDGILEIRIKDTGCGFEPEELARIFDPSVIQQEEDRYSDLSIAQNIINNHGGKVIIDSERGVGSEWIIQLPGLIG